MVSGHLHEKNGLFYMILNLVDENGNRKPKWIPTGLPVKGNKKRAEEMLMDARKSHSNMVGSTVNNSILFGDYIEKI